MAAGDLKIGLGIDIDLEAGTIDTTSLKKILATVLKELRIPTQDIKANLNVTPDIKFDRKAIRNSVKGFENDIRAALQEIDSPRDDEDLQGPALSPKQQKIFDVASRSQQDRAKINRLLNQVAPLGDILDDPSLGGYADGSVPKPRKGVLERAQKVVAETPEGQQPKLTDPQRQALQYEKFRPLNEALRTVEQTPAGQVPQLSPEQSAALKEFQARRALVASQLDKVTKNLSGAGLGKETLDAINVPEQLTTTGTIADANKKLSEATDERKQATIAKQLEAEAKRTRAEDIRQQKASTGASQGFDSNRVAKEKLAYEEDIRRSRSTENALLREQREFAAADKWRKTYQDKFDKGRDDAYKYNEALDDKAFKRQKAESKRKADRRAKVAGEADVELARDKPERVGKHSTAIDNEQFKRMDAYLANRQERLAKYRDRLPRGEGTGTARQEQSKKEIESQTKANNDLQNALKAQQKFYNKTPDQRESQIRSDTTASKREEATRERARNAQDKIDSTNQRLTQGRRLLEGAERDSDFSSRGRFPDSEEAKKTIEAANREKKDADALREKLRTKDAETGSDSSDELVALNKRIKDLDASIAKLTDTFRARTKEGSEADEKKIAKAKADQDAIDFDKDIIDRGRVDSGAPFSSFNETDSKIAKQAIQRELGRNLAAKKEALAGTKSTDPAKATEAAKSLDRLEKEAEDLTQSLNALDQHVKGVSKTLNENRRLEQKNAKANTPEAQAARAQAARDLDIGNRLVDDGSHQGFRNVQNTQEGRLALDAIKARKAQNQVELGTLNEQRSKGVKGLAGDYARLNDRIHQNDKAMQTLQRRMTGFGAAASQTTLLLRQFFRYAVGYHVLYAAAGAVAAFGQSLVDLDTELTSITAITGANAGELGEIESAIKRIATTTRFTNTEIAKSARVLAQSGVDPDKIRETLAATAQFAAATGGTIEVSADLISTMRKVFDELEAVDISDKLATAINISKLTAEDLKPILSISANIAKSYNLTADQYLAAVTTLRNAGLKASTVATGLRQGLVELFAPKTKTLKALQLRYREIGEVVSKEDIATRFKGFKESPEPLKEVLQELDRLGFSDEGDRTIGSRSFNIRAENAIKALVSNADALASAQAKLSISGSSLLGSQIQLESLSATVDNLGATITVFGDSLTDGAIPTLQDFVAHSVEALRTLTELNDELKADSGAGYGTILKAAAGVGAAAFGFTRGGLLEKGRNATVAAVATTALGPYGVQKIDDAGYDPARAVDSLLTATFMAPMIASVVRYMQAKVPVLGGNIKSAASTVASRAQSVFSTARASRDARYAEAARRTAVDRQAALGRSVGVTPRDVAGLGAKNAKAAAASLSSKAGKTIGIAAQIGIFVHLLGDMFSALGKALFSGGVLKTLGHIISKAGPIGLAIGAIAGFALYILRGADEAKRQRQKYQQKVRNLQDKLSQTTELEQEAEGLQFSDIDGSPAKSGSSAELLETLDRELERLDERTELVLKANAEDIGEYLKRLDKQATAGSASRAAVLRDLANFALSGDVKASVLELADAQGRLSDDQVLLTRDLTDLARSFVDSSEAVEGFREKLFAQYEQMLELGDAATDGQKALVSSVEALVFTADFDILSGDIDGSAAEVRGLMEDILRNTHEKITDQVKKQQEADKERLEEVIEEFDDVILAVDNPADIRQLIIELGLSTKRVGGSMEDLLLDLLDNLDAAEAAILAGRGRLVFDPDTGEIARDANGNEQRTYGPTKDKNLETIKTTRRLVKANLESTRNTENLRITQAEEEAEGVARNVVPKYYDLKKKVRDSLGADFELQIVELQAGIDKADAALKAGTRKEQYIFTDGDGNNTKPIADAIREFDSESLKQISKVDAQFEAVQPDIRNRVRSANREADAKDAIAAREREAIEASRDSYRSEFETFKRQQDAKRALLDANIAKANANIARAEDEINDAERVKQLPKFNEQLTKAIRAREEYERQALFDRKEAELEMNEALRILSQATRQGVIDRTPTGPAPLYAPDPAFDDTAVSLGRVGSRGLAYQRKGEDLDRLDRFGIDTRDTRLRTSAADADVLRDTIGLRREELVDFDAGKIEKDLKGEDRTAARQQRLKDLEDLNEQLGTVNSQIDQLGNTAWDEIQEGLDFETLAQSFESVGVALENMGEAINGIVVDGFSELGSTFNDSIRSGESFRDAVRSITADVADAIADMVANMIVQEAIAYGLRIIGGLFGGGATTGANSGLGADAGAGFQVARTGVSDVALLRTGIADVAALASNPMLMASGGMIHGPGTGTSDSIPGVILDSDGKIRRGIRVSDGEAILNAKATTALGKTTIDAINTGQITKMATGGIVGSSYETVANSSPAMQNSAGSSGGTALNFDDESPEDKFTIMNVVDKELFDDYLATPAGGRTLVNRIRKNSAAIKQVLR